MKWELYDLRGHAAYLTRGGAHWKISKSSPCMRLRLINSFLYILWPQSVSVVLPVSPRQPCYRVAATRSYTSGYEGETLAWPECPKGNPPSPTRHKIKVCEMPAGSNSPCWNVKLYNRPEKCNIELFLVCLLGWDWELTKVGYFFVLSLPDKPDDELRSRYVWYQRSIWEYLLHFRFIQLTTA